MYMYLANIQNQIIIFKCPTRPHTYDNNYHSIQPPSASKSASRQDQNRRQALITWSARIVAAASSMVARKVQPAFVRILLNHAPQIEATGFKSALLRGQKRFIQNVTLSSSQF